MADSLTTTFSIFFPHYSKPPKPFFRFIPTNIFSRRNKNEVTLCSPISSTPRSQDFGLVSTSEHPDGSFVFRFGDVSEIEKIVEMEEPCESKSVGEIKSEVKVESNERLLEVSEEGQVQALVSDINNNGSSNSLPGYGGERIQEDLDKDDNDENPGSTSIPLSDSSLRIESDEDLEKLDNVESSLMAAQEASLVGPGMVSVVEVPQYDVSEEISQENVDTEATRTEELARADSVESSITAAQADSVESSITAAQADSVESSITAAQADSVESSITAAQADSVETSIMASQSDNVESSIMAAQSDSVESSITAAHADSVVIPIISPMVDFPQKDVCEESTQENVGTEATGTEEYAPSNNVESPILAAQADSVQNPVNVPIAEVPDKKFREESSLKNSNIVGIGTEESDLSDSAYNSIVISQAHSVERSTLIESSPVSTLDVEKSVGQTASRDPTEASSAAAVEVKIHQTSVNGGESSTAGLFLSSGAALLLHPSKALTGGEESYLVTNLNWLGVADGVGEWSLEGSNPGVYAHELMENCGKIVSNSSIDSVINPLEVLNKSVEEAQSPGSSTILVAYFDGQTLHVANVGDSGFIIIRNGAVNERSSPMHHEFNFPLHVEKGHDPSELVEEYNIDLEEGDIIVTATDGLFDNLYEEEITYTVLISLQANINPQEIAKLLARRAQDVGMSSSRRSPFADAAQAAGYAGYTGGKLDDVAVIVSLVQSRSG